MRNLFENGVATTKEEKLFVLNTMLSDFAKESVISHPNVMSSYDAFIITKAITSDDVIKYSYVVREDLDIDNKVIDFSFAISDKDNTCDKVYLSLKILQGFEIDNMHIDELKEIFEDDSEWFINLHDFLKEINLL